MENQERMGTVHMKALDALKKMCEEQSIARVIGSTLEKFERLVQLAVENLRNVKNRLTKNDTKRLQGSKIEVQETKQDKNTGIFTIEDQQKYMSQIKNERGEMDEIDL